MSSTDDGPVQLDRYGIPITHNREQNRPVERRTSMTEDEQRERRASIKAIMNDPSLTPVERRLSIQGLMDGRRRSSCGGGVGMQRRASFGGGGYGEQNGAAVRRSSGGGFAQSGGDESNATEAAELFYANGTAAVADGFQPAAVSHAPTGELTPEQRQAQTFAVQRAITTRMERNRPPCEHYDRNCTMIAPCCGLAFGCRICHDECPVLPPPLLTEQQKLEQAEKMRKYQRSNSMPSSFTNLPDQDEQHKIDRFKVTEVICRSCFTRQSSKTNNCTSCNIRFGEYHCSICNLWMSGEESPYHCKDCGFCRVGGAENFRHCKECGMCIDSELFNEHSCKVGKYMSNCPVCQEDLFSSRAASHEMPCGHAIHWHCFRELASYDSRCPICKKTAETPERMASTWNAMAMGIALQPVPPEMSKVVDILCVDCETQDHHRGWHFLGVQCKACNSFNTSVEQILLAGPEAASFLREHGDGGSRGGGGIPNQPHEEQVAPQATFSRRASSFVPGSSAGGNASGGLLFDPYNLDDTDDGSDDDMDMIEDLGTDMTM